jgi:putative RecB family exonuclease
MKYKFRYLDEIIPEMEKTIESHLGSCVHSALEWLYRQIKNGSIPSVDEVVMNYSDGWKEEYDEAIPIVRKIMTAEDYFNRGVEFLINYYMEHHPFNDNTLEVEKEILFDLDKIGEYKIRGFIDRLSYNRETNEYEIHDYKTSKTLPTQEDFEKDRQLALYAIAIKEIYGKEKSVKLIWHYLSFKKKIHVFKTNEQLEELKLKTIDLIKEIHSTKEFEPNKSYLCGWCEYKSICPAWGNRQPEKQTSLSEF